MDDNQLANNTKVNYSKSNTKRNQPNISIVFSYDVSIRRPTGLIGTNKP